MFLPLSYPFEPIQLTLISVVTIGIPSFILALEPNNERINGKILINVLKKSIPTALTIVSNILIIALLPYIIRLTNDEVSTLCVILTGLTGFMLLYRICVPFNALRRILFSFLICLFSIGVLFFRELFSLTILNFKLLILVTALFMIAIVLFNIFTDLFYKISKKFKI